jgi:mRNA interferase MazF
MKYVPKRGDLIWIQLHPSRGHEQAGHRPALVLSPAAYNRRTGLCVLCPATRKAKGYAFEVPVTTGQGDTSVILADHVRCVDWRARGAELIQPVPADVLDEVIAKLDVLIIAPGE